MFSRFYIVFLFVNIFSEILALVELPQVEENNILETDAAVRQTTNELFSLLRFKVTKDQQNLKQYSLIHNYLVSTSLQDYTNLKEIAKLTRVDKTKLSNETQNFMAIVNEILNEDLNHDTVAEDQYVIRHIEGFLTNLEKYTGKYEYGETVANDILTEIVKILEKNDTFTKAQNKTVYTNRGSLESSDEEGNLIDDNEFWVPNARRIFQGKKTTIKDFPFMASIQVFNQFQCAGSIIKSDLIITAASCLQLTWNNRFFRENPSFLTARVGSSLPNLGGENIEVLEIYFHPEYEPKSLKNNLCILRLRRELKFRKCKRTQRVKKIELDRKANGLPVTTLGGADIDITIVGWGAKGIYPVAKDHFMSFAVLDVYPVHECQAIYSSDFVTQKHFCAGFLSRGGGACSRDIGGPGVMNGILVGVVSFGSAACGTPDAPTVFTKVGFYANWIDSIIEQNTVIAKKKTTTLREFAFTSPYNLMFKKVKSTFTFKPPTFTKKKATDQIEILRAFKDKRVLKDFVDTATGGDEAKEWLRETADQDNDTTISTLIPVTKAMIINKKEFKEPLNIYHKASSETIGELSELESDKTLAPKIDKELETQIETGIMEIISRMNDFYNDSQSEDIPDKLQKMPTVAIENSQTGNAQQLEKSHNVVLKKNFVNKSLKSDSESEYYEDSNESGLEIPSELVQNVSDITYLPRSKGSDEYILSKQDLIQLFSEALKEELLMKTKITTEILYKENDTRVQLRRKVKMMQGNKEMET